MRRGLLQTSCASQVTSRLKSLVEPQSARRAETEAERRSESKLCTRLYSNPVKSVELEGSCVFSTGLSCLRLQGLR